MAAHIQEGQISGSGFNFGGMYTQCSHKVVTQNAK